MVEEEVSVVVRRIRKTGADSGTPTMSAVRKLITLFENCGYRTLGFLVKYRRLAMSTWVGLHPRARPTISVISVSRYWYPNN